MSTQPERLAVELGERRYDILVGPGLVARAGAEIRPLMRRRQAVVISDESSIDAAWRLHATSALVAGLT